MHQFAALFLRVTHVLPNLLTASLANTLGTQRENIVVLGSEKKENLISQCCG